MGKRKDHDTHVPVLVPMYLYNVCVFTKIDGIAFVFLYRNNN